MKASSPYSEKLERITAIDAFALGPELDQGVERSDTRCLLALTAIEMAYDTDDQN